MATPEELFAQIQSYQPTATPVDTGAQAAQQAQEIKDLQAQADFYGRLGTALSSAGQGLTFGLSDEVIAGLGSLFGGPSYSEGLAQQQAQREQMREQYPITATAAEIGGGIVGPIGATALRGVRGALGASRAAPGLLQRAITGEAAKAAAPTVAELATTGAIQGGLYGAGSAQPGERLSGALFGAGLGGVASPVVGKAAQFAIESLGSRIATAPMTLSPEAGVIGAGAAPRYTPAEIQLAKVLSQAAPEATQTAQQELIRAGLYGKPIFIPEAVSSPALYQQAKLVANYPASIEIAKTAIEERAADAVNRITKTLDVVNPERNVNAGANKLVSGAKALLDDLGVARKEATKGLYESAFERTPELTSEDAIKFVQSNPRIQQAIKAVRQELPELVDKPDTSLEVLHQAQQYLSGKARSLKNKFTAGKVTDARNALMKAMKTESPDYAQATDTFAQMSKGLTAKEQSKIGFLANVNPERPESIGRVFALDADVISSLRNDFVAAGRLDEWESGLRAYLQRAVEKAQDERNPINKIIGSPDLRNKLQAALGDKYDTVIDPLEVEQKILKGQREYFAGSPTEPLRQTEESLQESVGAIRSAFQAAKDPAATIGKALSKVLGGRQDDEFYQNYARLLFTQPEQGLETLGKVSQLITALRKARQAGETVGGIAGSASGREAAAGADIMQEQVAAQRAKGGMAIPAIADEAELDKLFGQIQEFESAPKMPIAIKVGKQNISIPQGEQYAPSDLVKAVIMAESAGNPNAISPKGAGGLMQIMPATAKELGMRNRFNPKDNVEGGSKYLKQQLKAAAKEVGFEDPKLAAAAYNWGPGNLSNAIKKVKAEGENVTWDNIKDIVKVPRETREYVDKVMLLRKYDDYDLAKIAAKIGEEKLDAALSKFKTGNKFTVGDLLDELGISASEVKVKRSNVLQSAKNLKEA